MSGGPFAYEKWGGPTFYSSTVGGGSNFKVGGGMKVGGPTFNGGVARAYV